jgi:hypothetical protein
MSGPSVILWLMRGKSIAEIIDEMLAAPKEIGGEPVWQQHRYRQDDLARLKAPVLINGTSSEVDLVITVYPLQGPSRFRILLNAPKCVWRVDHVDDEHHVNSLLRPTDLAEYEFTAPHYHAWEDNRDFATFGSLPDELPNARVMSASSFDSTLRWFCSKVNIAQPPSGLIDPPSRRFLL